MRFWRASSVFSASVSGRWSLSPTAPIPSIQNPGVRIAVSFGEEGRTIFSFGHNHTPPPENRARAAAYGLLCRTGPP
jgi:hypothetical protein